MLKICNNNYRSNRNDDRGDDLQQHWWDLTTNAIEYQQERNNALKPNQCWTTTTILQE